MAVVPFLILAWFCILVLVSLQRKLPLGVNLLLFMALEVVLTNKLTIVGFNMHLFRINTTSIHRFLALILHNDFSVICVLLTFANVFLLSSKTSVRAWISIYAFTYQVISGELLRWNRVLTDTGWNFVAESLMILAVMAYTLLLGYIFQRMASKERWIR